MEVVSYWLVILSLILFIAYAIRIGRLRKDWQDCPQFEPENNFTPQKKVSVIIPARNESANILNCLSSLQHQTYPGSLMEVIVVDDHSEDNTAELVRNFPLHNLRLIQLQDELQDSINSYKKKAIEVAVRQATGEWIITTDADCTAGPDWIKAVMAYETLTEALLIAAPVKLAVRQNLLEIFQALDFITMQGVTAACVHRKKFAMSNGANLGYSKSAFVEVGGFENIDDLASGDDMLLMQKIKDRFPEKIFYLKSSRAIVSSLPARTWSEFWQQRIRWASKAERYEDKKLFRLLLLIYAFNFCMFLLFVVSFWHPDAFLVAFILLVCKTMIESPFVYPVSEFFEQQKLMRYFPFLQPLHLVYIVVAGFLGKFSKYEWKGRKVK